MDENSAQIEDIYKKTLIKISKIVAKFLPDSKMMYIANIDIKNFKSNYILLEKIYDKNEDKLKSLVSFIENIDDKFLEDIVNELKNDFVLSSRYPQLWEDANFIKFKNAIIDGRFLTLWKTDNENNQYIVKRDCALNMLRVLEKIKFNNSILVKRLEHNRTNILYFVQDIQAELKENSEDKSVELEYDFKLGRYLEILLFGFSEMLYIYFNTPERNTIGAIVSWYYREKTNLLKKKEGAITSNIFSIYSEFDANGIDIPLALENKIERLRSNPPNNNN